MQQRQVQLGVASTAAVLVSSAELAATTALLLIGRRTVTPRAPA